MLFAFYTSLCATQFVVAYSFVFVPLFDFSSQHNTGLASFQTTGLLDDFQRSCCVDSTIKKLQHELPLVLSKALDQSSAENLYSKEFVLLGPNNEELASDRNELISLSNTIVTASTATQQARRLARSLTSAPTEEDGFDDTIVTCNMILDVVKLDKLMVEWSTLLVGRGSKISGKSEFVFDQEGLVSQHKLLAVKIDGRRILAVGEALAALRRAFLSVKDSPLLSPLASSFPLLNGIREELLQQSSSKTQVSSLKLPYIYATDSYDLSFINSTRTNLTLIDDFDTPFPGSIKWESYMTSHQVIERFIEKDIPVLSTGSPKVRLYDLFSSDCQLCGIDGTELCSGGDAVADYYRALASIRKGTMADLRVIDIQVDWKTRSVQVEYTSKNALRIEGKDTYILSSSENPLVDRVNQLELIVSGTKVEDPDWFRQFYSTVKMGSSTIGADVFMDLLQKVDTGSLDTNREDLLASAESSLSGNAAASVYGILTGLHRDLVNLPTLSSPPVAEYFAPSIELKGYFNEALARGQSSYNAVVGVALASFRGALRTERIVLEHPPKPTITFEADGKIRVDLILQLRLKTPLPANAALLPVQKLQLSSTYRTNRDGMIVEHSIVETRVNGRLTPGDVVSRFFKPGLSSDTKDQEGSWYVQSALDALSLARSFGSDQIND